MAGQTLIWNCGRSPAAPGAVVLLHHGAAQPQLPVVPQGLAALPQRFRRDDGRFPAKADELLSADDFAAYIRDDALDAGRAERVLHELRRCSGDHTAALPRNAREGALITVDSFVGRGAHWCYWSTDAAAQLPMAAVLCWLGDFLAGTERRTLQSCPEAVQLAAQWQADLASPFACPVDRMPQPMAPAAPAAARRASAQPVQNPRWQSILAVLATV